MRIFCDTNIVTELIQERSQVELVDRIFEAAEKNKWSRVLSVGSFYTITYIVERFLKSQDIHKPILVEQQRDILSKLLEAFEIQDLDHSRLSDGVTDTDFTDLEDSYQYQCALKPNVTFCSPSTRKISQLNHHQSRFLHQKNSLMNT